MTTRRPNTRCRCALKLIVTSWVTFAVLTARSFAADGFYVAQPHPNIIGWGVIDYVDALGGVSTFYEGPGVPYALAWDGSAYLYASVGDTIQRFGLDGTSSTVASGLNSATGLAFDNSGNLFVASYVASTISRIAADGTMSTFATGLALPVGLAFDNNGNLFVANRLNTSLSVFAPDGAASTFASGLEDPQFLAFDNHGNLYVSIYGNNTPTTDTIAEITSDGNVTTFAAGLESPQQLVFDANGDLYVANRLGNGIHRITPSGENAVFASGLYLPTGLAAGPAPIPEPSPIVLLSLFSVMWCFRYFRRTQDLKHP